ncbi:MAG TPA: TraB/GumN family protein, partial [Chitinophagaceae bacterium]|nr:TraB/GumN family protein [Chitinophagaceae bacterium]
MRKLLFLLFIHFLSIISFSQKTTVANTLLWRISGNGLTRPSYLFGTIHLTDKRVFNFGDSLY